MMKTKARKGTQRQRHRYRYLHTNPPGLEAAMIGLHIAFRALHNLVDAAGDELDRIDPDDDTPAYPSPLGIPVSYRDTIADLHHDAQGVRYLVENAIAVLRGLSLSHFDRHGLDLAEVLERLEIPLDEDCLTYFRQDAGDQDR